MKKLLLLTVLLAASFACAQSTHSVDVIWSTPSSDASGNPPVIYTVYRAPSACSANPLASAFVRVGTASATATKFTDTAVPLGPFCYVVTFTVNTAESAFSNLVPAVVLPAAPVLGNTIVR